MTERPPAPTGRVFCFGPFRLLAQQQLLLDGEAPVRLGSRAIEVLCALVESPGTLVTKRDLMARAWHGTVVEQSNLKVTIAALRRALGDGRPGHRYIANISGLGYRFVAPVQRIDADGRDGPRSNGLPQCATRLVGRAEVISALVRSLPERRMVTITGAGGIGKTSVALAVVSELAEDHQGGAHVVDLAPLADPRFLPMAVANALGIAIYGEDPAEALVSALRQRRGVLVLDGCEHVLDAAAALVDRIVAGAPDVLVLATTREPLRIRGETVHRLAPLPVPVPHAQLTAAEALAFPAVELFVRRAAACLDGFGLSDADAPIVAGICERLDGIALAIELAATRVEAFTLRELSLLLEDRLRLLGLEQRGVAPRHRSLAAALAWSHDLLAPNDRMALRRVAVFAGSFTLASATALAGGDCDMVAAMESLTAKSLVCADVRGSEVRYRLLDTTRAFAAQKLQDSGEAHDLHRRHAEHLVDVLTRVEREARHQHSADWVAAHGHRVDDVRGALAWAFSPAGDARLGIALTVCAIPLWTQLSLLDECRDSTERALAIGTGQSLLAVRDRMRLGAALAQATLYTRGPRPETDALWKDALRDADDSGDASFQLRTLWGLSVYLVFAGQYHAALGYLRRLRIAARRHGDAADRLGAERLIATNLHYFGRQGSARARLDKVLQAGADPVQHADISRFQFDQRVVARGTMASVLWLQGLAEQALHIAHEAVESAQAASHPVSLCNALGHTAIPIALYTGDLAAADALMQRLRAHLRQHALNVWCMLSHCLQGMIGIERGDGSCVDELASLLGKLRASGYGLRQSFYGVALARGQALAGRHGEALVTLDNALALCEQTAERWFLPEVLRIKGELLRQDGSPATRAEAQQLFRQSMGMARRQGALALELRATLSLAELLAGCDRTDEAAGLVDAIRSRFTEGHRTADLKRAARLAADLHEAAPRAGRIGCG
ncbi:winged helix-turn-helix domain-containing protein [Rhizobacter sp. OV335]|uniref:ATP-binding protein n=1 Tax=Rhizobacter sp. OV335 TaxID=1500264 RepID=UPI00091BB72E|nr:winged helix-turn-helix domain-containing protein [Rhizobacter sp. OV335]SHN08154.1 Predicted ATPase [Rhizobacter sp. OV335]